MLLIVAGMTLFLRNVGPAHLPLLYLLLNLLSIGIQIAALSLPNLSSFALSVAMTVVLLFINLLLLPFITTAQNWMLFLLLLAIRIHDNFAFTYYISYLQSIFSIRESKAQIGRILAVSSFACMLAGLTVKPLLSITSIKTVFTLAALTTGILTLGLKYLHQRHPPQRENEEEVKKGSGLSESMRLLRESSLARTMVQVLLLGWFLRYLIDFQHQQTISYTFTSEKDLATFIGVFGALVALANSLGQWALTHRLFRIFKVGGSIAVASSCYIVLCLIVVLFPKWYLIVASQGLWIFLHMIATRPACNVLLGVLKDDKRDKLAILNALAAAFGSLLAGLVLWLGASSLSTRTIYLLLSAFYILQFYWAKQMDGAYFKGVQQRLQMCSEDLSESAEPLGRFLTDEQFRRQLQSVLSDEDVIHKLRFILRSRGNRKDKKLAQQLASMLDSAPNKIATLALLKAVGLCGSHRNTEKILPFLNSEDAQIKSQAAASVIVLANDEAELTNALLVLSRMLNSDKSVIRLRALDAMIILSLPCFIPEFQKALSDEDPDVRIAAIDGLAQFGPASQLAYLKKFAALEENPKVRKHFQDECSFLQDQVVDSVMSRMDNLAPEDRADVIDLLSSSKTGMVASLAGLLHYSTNIPSELFAHLAKLEDKHLELVRLATDKKRASLTPMSKELENPAIEELFSLLSFVLPKEISIRALREANDRKTAFAIVKALSSTKQKKREQVGQALLQAQSQDEHLAALALDFLEETLSEDAFETINYLLDKEC